MAKQAAESHYLKSCYCHKPASTEIGSTSRQVPFVYSRCRALRIQGVVVDIFCIPFPTEQLRTFLLL